MKPPKGLVKQASKTLKKATPTILTCLGAIGVIATAVLAVKATPKALERIEDAKEVKNDENEEKLTRMETIAVCWQCYIPAVATGIATIGCIFGANVLNHRQQASLVSAYALLNRAYTDYKRKLKELYGEDAHQRIMKELAVEKAEDVHITGYITGYGLYSNICLEFEDANEEPRLFYDSFGERYFQSTISKVLEAEYHLNRNFVLGGFVPLNQFYEFLGIDKLEDSDELGWYVSDEIYWIDFNHEKMLIDDGAGREEIECYIIDMPFAPSIETPE